MTLRSLDPAAAASFAAEEGIAVDLRAPDAYLAAHVRGSVPLLYEAGPGLGGRARDLLPLDAPLLVLDDGTSPLEEAAAALRGKGFEVVGSAPGAEAWPPGLVEGTPDVPVESVHPALPLVDVADPGTIRPETVALHRVPAELLWRRAGELPRDQLGVLAGWGVRAAAAVGILERLGFSGLVFVRTRPPRAAPPMAGPEAFRIGG